MAYRSPNTDPFMETKTAFDLNTAIQRWRDHLRQAPSFRPENLEELETHLRDAVAALRGTALSEEEAFLVVARRLGGAPVLEPEFAKVNGKEVWLNRVLWMLLGAQLWPLVSGCAGAVADTTVLSGLLGFGHHFKSLTHPVFVFPASVDLVVLLAAATAKVLAVGGCLAACWWVLRQKGRTFANAAASLLRRPLLVLILACAIVLPVLWCCAFAKQVFLFHWLSPATHSGMYASMIYGSSLSSLVVGPALAILTVLLTRRQVRLSANS